MTTDLRTRRREGTRQDIIDAAWLQAEEVGIAGISLRDLAAAVGMRAPSLYTYFPSKDAIYDAMFAEGYRALDAQLTELVERLAGEDRLRVLTVSTESFVAFCQASTARYQLMFTVAIPGWQPSADAYAVSLASYERTTEELDRLGIRTDDARDLYLAVVAGLAAQQMANDPTGDRWRRLAGDAMEMLIKHLDDKEEGSR